MVYCYNCAESLDKCKNIKNCPFCGIELYNPEESTISENKGFSVSKNKSQNKVIPQVPQDDLEDIESKIIRKVIIKKQCSDKQLQHLEKMRKARQVKKIETEAVKKAELKHQKKEVVEEPEPVPQKPYNPYENLFSKLM